MNVFHDPQARENWSYLDSCPRIPSGRPKGLTNVDSKSPPETSVDYSKLNPLDPLQ